MSLLDQNSLIEIKLYYKYVPKDSGKMLIVMDREKALKQMESPDEKISKEVEILETRWRPLTWKEQNDVMSLSSQTTNPQTGEKQFNFLAYRDAIIKKCLKEWNVTVKDAPIPVTPEAIDSLPGSIVINLYQQFETMIDYKEDELGN